MKLISIHDLSPFELSYITDEIHPYWQQLSVSEERLPFKENIPYQLTHSYSVYYPYCLKSDNEIVGIFTLREKDLTRLGVRTQENSIWLMDLFVMQNHRKQGIGSHMVQEAKRLAKEKNYKYIYLQCLHKLKIYFTEKHGFVTDYWVGAIYDMPATVVMKFTL